VFRVGIYGSNGYLGKSICASYPKTLKIDRNALVDSELDVIIDCSFPNGNEKQSVTAKYLDLIHRRAQYYKSLNIRYIYLGSYSSIHPLKNKYGRVKYRAEQLVLEQNGIIVKLGLVVNSNNPGGRYFELTKILKKMPILVLPHERTFEIFVDREHEVIQSLSTWNQLKPASTYLLKTTKKSSLGIVAGDALPTKSTFSLGPISSYLLEKVVRSLPSDFLGALKGISVKRSLDFNYIVLMNDS
jgi:predicted transcriptional regulator with HTH domain